MCDSSSPQISLRGVIETSQQKSLITESYNITRLILYHVSFFFRSSNSELVENIIINVRFGDPQHLAVPKNTLAKFEFDFQWRRM